MWTPAGTVASERAVNTMTQAIPKSTSRKVNGYVKTMLALDPAFAGVTESSHVEVNNSCPDPICLHKSNFLVLKG